MKEGDRVICKASKKHGKITDVSKSYYGYTKYYWVIFDGEMCEDINIYLRKDLKPESSLWQRVIYKFKKR